MSKTTQELAPHIEEIQQALKDENIESHEIETELDTFVNTYGIALPEAKRAVIKKFGGNPRTLSPRRTFKVEELRDGLFRVDIQGRLLSLEKRSFERDGEERFLFTGILGDETGKIEFTAWEDYGFQEGKVYQLTNTYTKVWRGRVQLNCGKNTMVEVLEDETLPAAGEIQKESLMNVDRLTQIGGAPGVRVEGFLVEVKNGSGLIFRCPECKRALQKNNCMIHGQMEGKPDLRIKGVLDDGYGALFLFAQREVTEGLLGMDLDECKKVASDRMDHGAIQDIIEEKILNRFVSSTGDVATDDYGTKMFVKQMSIETRNVKEEAMEMLGAMEG